MILSQFQTVGRDLFTRGLISSHSGGMSIRRGDRLFITRRGSMLGCLSEHDLVETGISRNNRGTPRASSELALHRMIYRETPARAIVHAHPPHAIALSLTDGEVAPFDGEGSALFSKVPVLGRDTKLRAEELAQVLVQALKENRIVLLCGHGSFAIGQLLEEAYQCTTALEDSCKIICLLRSLGTKTPPSAR